MSENKKRIIYRCPECFAKDADVNLKYDDRKSEYYCTKCCYTGSEKDILNQYKIFQKNKYRTIELFK